MASLVSPAIAIRGKTAKDIALIVVIRSYLTDRFDCIVFHVQMTSADLTTPPSTPYLTRDKRHLNSQRDPPFLQTEELRYRRDQEQRKSLSRGREEHSLPLSRSSTMSAAIGYPVWYVK